ncbi:MAG: mechanosensitive ion channel family protein [Cyanobacteria bacterium]|nr:mechanosensitive ion channel family protein [Cyanobacteriota bacterium]
MGSSNDRRITFASYQNPTNKLNGKTRNSKGSVWRSWTRNYFTGSIMVNLLPDLNLLGLQEKAGALGVNTTWWDDLFQDLWAKKLLLIASIIKVCFIIVISFLAIRAFHLLCNRAQGWMALYSEKIGPRLGQDGERDSKRIFTLIAILKSIVSGGIGSLALLIILNELGVNITPLLAGAGIVGAAIAFGTQSLVKDIIYGYFILAENQFGIGDVIEAGNMKGTVEKMSFRSVLLRDSTGAEYILPNGEISRITVYPKAPWAEVIDIGVHAENVSFETLLNVGNAVMAELSLQYQEGIIEPIVMVGLGELLDEGIYFKIKGRVKTPLGWEFMTTYRQKFLEAVNASLVSQQKEGSQDLKESSAPSSFTEGDASIVELLQTQEIQPMQPMQKKPRIRFTLHPTALGISLTHQCVTKTEN